MPRLLDSVRIVGERCPLNGESGVVAKVDPQFVVVKFAGALVHPELTTEDGLRGYLPDDVEVVSEYTDEQFEEDLDRARVPLEALAAEARKILRGDLENAP